MGVAAEKSDNRAQDQRTVKIARKDLLIPLVTDMLSLEHSLEELSLAEAQLTCAVLDGSLASFDGYFERLNDLTAQKAAKQDELNRKKAGAEAFYRFIVARLAERDEEGIKGPELTPDQMWRTMVDGAPLHNDKLVIS